MYKYSIVHIVLIILEEESALPTLFWSQSQPPPPSTSPEKMGQWQSEEKETWKQERGNYKSVKSWWCDKTNLVSDIKCDI